MLKSTHRLPGLSVSNHEFILPVNHAQPNAGKLSVFAREVVATDRAGKTDLPWLVFFQGGPGFQAPRPSSKSGWLKRAVRDYRVLLLDQRGTGLSTAITFQTLARLGTPTEQAEYLKHFRADSIVRDAEMIRQELVGADKQWSGLGQSYGGFCLTHYLSAASYGLKEVFITGGLPPVEDQIDQVYRATYRRVLAKNRLYFARYPEDAALANEIVEYLQRNDVRLPGGGRLTDRRFQQLGLNLGFSDGFEAVHYLLETAFVLGMTGRELSYSFLRGCENALSFETNPIYALLHEPIYCQKRAANWSAKRVLSEFPEFCLDPGKPFSFTGEMVYPWMFDDYEYLQPLKKAAQILAEYDEWPELYDARKLGQAETNVAAAVFYDDMYVEMAFSEKTAALIPGIKLWITNEYEHNAIRADGDFVLDRLVALMKGER
jgi:pimeloyl-ACP methyl ester carboxylesterase